VQPRSSRLGRLTTWASGRGPELAAAAFGLAWFLAIGGWPALDPTDLDWLAGDQRQHALGWLFFRRSPWGFPIGRISELAWPVGTTVGYTDANPVVAVLLKPFSALLPRDFHYVGWWLAACFALQGWFGARLAALASAGATYRLLSGMFLVLAPVLAFRIAHDTLCAHFTLLALLFLLLRPATSAPDARRSIRIGTFTVVLVTLVHPVLAAMALVLLFALCYRLAKIERMLPGREAARRAFVALIAKGLALLAFGYITSAPAHLWGFGRFSADPLAWVNPLAFSRFLPDLPIGEYQYEGFHYLGLGGLLLLAIAVAGALAHRRLDAARARFLAPVLVASALMYVFALSSVIRVLGHTVLDLRWLYAPIYGVVGAYRSSGRFVWPLYYLLLALALVALPRLLGGRRRAAVALAAVIAVQLADVSVIAGERIRSQAWRLSAPEWALMAGEYRHLALVPPQIVGVGGACHDEEVYGHDYGFWAPFAYQAYAAGTSFNSAFLSRGSTRRMEPACRALLDEFRAGRLREDTVYVVSPTEQDALARHAGVATCGSLDGFLTCVASARTSSFATALSAHDAR
jgi:hypothetical protein